jgi:uncharacterized protein YdaU (DUF1376 family)
MTPEQEGAYIRLLCHAWASEDCGLPNDDKQLAVLSRLNEKWFNGGSTVVRACFKAKGNRLFNERLLEEREKQRLWAEKSRKGGLHSQKAQKDKELQSKGGSQMVDDCLQPNGNTSSSSLSSSSSSNSSLSSGKEKVIFAHESKPYEMAVKLSECILSNNPKAKEHSEATLQKWARAIDKLNRIDEQPWDDISEVIEWCQNSEFWLSNILSGDKLRAKYQTLYMQMKRTGGDNGKNRGRDQGISQEAAKRDQELIDKYRGIGEDRNLEDQP